MVGQTYQQPQTAAPSGEQIGEFQPIPTRIQEVPELIVEPAVAQVHQEMTENLGDLARRLGTIHMTAAEAYLSQGKYAEAVPHIEAAVGMDPSDGGNINQLGYVRYLAGDDNGALQALDQVLAIDPNNADALFNVGMISFGLEDLARAETSFRGCSRQDPNNPEVWNNLGVVLFKQGRIDDARRCFQRTLQVDSTNEDAQFNLQNI